MHRHRAEARGQARFRGGGDEALPRRGDGASFPCLPQCTWPPPCWVVTHVLPRIRRGRSLFPLGPACAPSRAGFCTFSGRPLYILGPASAHSRAGLFTFSGRPVHILGPACSHSRAGLCTFSGRPLHILGPACTHPRAGLYTSSGGTKNARKNTEIEVLIKMQNDLVLDRQ